MRKSKSPYPDDWNEIAIRVKTLAGWRCIRCNHPHDPAAGYTLTVHHLDMDPQNCAWWNLVALCQACHLRIQGRLIMERYWMFDHSPWIQPYIACYYANMHNLPTDKQYVMDHLAQLLEYGKPKLNTLIIGE